MNGSLLWIVGACAVYGVIFYSMRYCREHNIENPILTFRLWLAERKDRA